jgi:lysine 2,3-aminomutase
LHGAGKIPLSPNYLISASDDAVVLRNYEGMIFRYEPGNRTHDGSNDSPLAAGQGISSLLGAGSAPLVPTNGARQVRRRANARLHKIAANGSDSSEAARPNGGSNGHATNPLNPTNGNGKH